MSGLASLGPAQGLLFFMVGLGLGLVFFALLRHGVQVYIARGGLRRVLPLYMGRLAVAALVFWGIAQQGAWPLILALAGFVAARIIIQRRTKVN